MSLNNMIVINRGDSYEFNLDIIDRSANNTKYTLTGNDAIYFGLMDVNQFFEGALVKKKFTVDDLDEAGNLTIKLLPEDTLDLFPGKYYYAIKLKIDHTDEYGDNVEQIQTIVNNTKFIICD